MRVLLDAQVFLWLHSTPERVGAALPLLEDQATVRLVSAVAWWEIAIKYGLGRPSSRSRRSLGSVAGGPGTGRWPR